MEVSFCGKQSTNCHQNAVGWYRGRSTVNFPIVASAIVANSRIFCGLSLIIGHWRLFRVTTINSAVWARLLAHIVYIRARILWAGKWRGLTGNRKLIRILLISPLCWCECDQSKKNTENQTIHFVKLSFMISDCKLFYVLTIRLSIVNWWIIFCRCRSRLARARKSYNFFLSLC